MWLTRPTSAAAWTCLIIGCALSALGAAMMVAWQFEAATLLKLGDAWPMIRFNTAALFFISGLAMVASTQQRRRWAVGLALLVVLMASARALERSLNLDVGLEYLLHQPRDEFIRSNGIGRGALGTAICFILFGIAIIDRQSPRLHPAIASLLGYFISLLGLVALYRYGMGTDPMIGWRLTTGMALSTALGIFLLGIAAVAMAIASSEDLGPSPWLVAYPAAFTLAAASFIVWIELKQVQSIELRRDTADATENLRLHLLDRITTRVYAVEDLSRNWGRLSTTQRRSEVETLLRKFGCLRAVDWINDDFRTAWHGAINDFNATVGEVLPAARRRDLIRNGANRSLRFFPEADLTHGDVRIVGYASTFDDAHVRTGFTATVFRVDALFDQLAQDKRLSRFAFAVKEGRRQLYCSSTPGVPRAAVVEGIPFKARGLPWRIEVWPTPATVAAQSDRLPNIALAKGLLGAALLGLAIHLRQRAARRTAEAEQSASAWRDSEQRFELAVSASNGGIWEWHPERTTFYASRRYRELFGYPVDGDDLDTDDWYRRLHPEDRPRVEQALQAHVRDHAPYDVITRYYKMSGEVIWIRIRGSSTWDEAGKHVRMAGSTVDITQQVEAEHRLLAQVDTIAAANYALTEMARAARAAAQAKSAFLRNMSHELRTPLNSIIGFSSGLLRRAETHPLDEHQRDRLQRIVASGQHLLELVNHVLDIAKFEASQSKLHVEQFSLTQLFDEVTAMAEILLQKKPDVRLHARIDADVPTPSLDQTKLKQILLNLLGNAVKFTDQGSITLTASFDGIHWRFAVSDTGIGIAVEDQQRIFDTFEQLEAHDQSTEGTGLGLTICELLGHAMGGAISVKSRFGVGSTFTFVVPQSPIAGSLNHASAPASQAPAAVLIPQSKPSEIVDDPSDGITFFLPSHLS